jgi:uncharacterized protein (UPF0333 family)
MKQPSNRGAARIGAVWMIVVIVLFFVAMAFAYVSNQATEQASAKLLAAQNALQVAEAEKDVAQQLILDVTRPTGFNDQAVIGSKSDPAKIVDGVAVLRTAFGLGDSVATLEATIGPVVSAFSAEQAKVATYQGRISDLQSQLAAAQSAASQAASTQQTAIETLRTEKEDETSLLQARIDELEGDLASMTADRNSKDDELNSEKSSLDALALTLEQEKDKASNIQTILNRQIDDVQKRVDTPDGAILSVSEDLGIGWINRGSKHRVSEGMVFDVRTGHPNPANPNARKASCEILKVSELTSEVRIFDEADQFDPVVQSDVILSPIYDPEGDKYAVLAGRFGGKYNEAELTLMLEDVGITVQKELDLTTNFLIVGQPMYVDENGDALDEPRQPSELEVYKNAQAQGCSIITINEFRQYFRR